MELFEDDLINSAESDYGELDDLLEKLEAISPQARDDAHHALLYGFSEHSPARPPLAAIRRFVRKILAAPEKAGQIRTDRIDPDTEQVQIAAWKVIREFDRLRGLLRFSPEPAVYGKAAVNSESMRYTARCAPDHFVLLLLADHFFLRFGSTSWAIIDEKRNLIVAGENGKTPVLRKLDQEPAAVVSGAEQVSAGDEWENLWKNYHRSINNEDRANPELQKQFMPRRYWKYLPELQ